MQKKQKFTTKKNNHALSVSINNCPRLRCIRGLFVTQNFKTNCRIGRHFKRDHKKYKKGGI